ncbi:uncharacterized protein LOC141696889 [Apium graveolens]|uniref:uncharacterized protein LOC141696889 n=1 Tax=Apium graveolens TaxID=4045 RepID=UPI003D79F1F1
MASQIASDVSLAKEEISSEVNAAVSLANEEISSEVSAAVSLANEEISNEVSAAVSLTRFILLRNAHSPMLLGIVKGDPTYLKNYVKFNTPTVGMLEARFEVHKSTTENMVHIRSCYNNRYLTLEDDEDFVVAKAENTEEDQSKRSCTLFYPTRSTDSSNRLFNAHLGKRLCFWRSDNVNRGLLTASLRADQPAGDYEDVFTFIDWESLVILPRYVAFHNSKYLKGAKLGDLNYYLQFSQEYVTSAPNDVGNEIIQTADRYIHIRNMYWNKHWASRGQAAGEAIKADSNTLNNLTLFEAVNLGDDTIGLKNVAENKFCKSLSFGNFLVADMASINAEGTFKVRELVKERRITNYDFHLDNARIYNETIQEMDTNIYINNTSTPEKHMFNLEIKEVNTTTWSNSISLKFSYTSSVSVGIPGIAEGTVTIGAEVSDNYTWGATQTKETKTTKGYEKEVLPGTRVVMRVISTRGLCDVPFSYTLRDVLYTGDTIVKVVDDGIFTGGNNYFYEVQSSEGPANPNPADNINAEPEWKTIGKLSESWELIPVE